MNRVSLESGHANSLPRSISVAEIKSAAGRGWLATTSFLSSFLKSVQVARMASVLEGMTDKQLAEIGITSRNQIWHHAEKLIYV